MFYLDTYLFKKERIIYRISAITPFIFLFIVLYLHKTRIHGDASIYFTFIRDFFKKPFTYGYEVKHGATSPLWVILNSVPYSLLGFDKWLVFATCLNKIFIFGGILLNVYICIGNKKSPISEKENLFSILFLVLAYMFLYSLFISSTQLYETALLIFLPPFALFLLKINWKNTGIFLAGCSMLIRPEYLLFFLSAIFFISENKKNFWKYLLVGISSTGVVYGYLFFMTGTLLPSSFLGRIVRSLENKNISYIEKLFISIGDLYRFAPSLLFILPLFIFFVVLNFSKFRSVDRIKNIMFFTSVLLVFIYFIFPPMNYSGRYLLTLVPVLFPWITMEIVRHFSKYSKIAIVIMLPLFLFALYQHLQLNKPENYKYSFDRILGNDFAEEIRRLDVHEKSKILIYEIQFQFNTSAQLVSADGIVGGEILPCLLKEQNEEEFIKQYDIDYIVVSNAFKYRNIYKDTFFSRIFKFDLSSPIGSQYILSDIVLTKVATNPVLLNPELFRIENGIPVYSSKDTLWKHHSLLWNSVYKVEKPTNK
ncbi:MAG: hypothetical protein LDL53_08830 [Candidatus Hydrogenedens sp.]|nr:hypothetical protein [Candidatus Hydrogenedens sp.]